MAGSIALATSVDGLSLTTGQDRCPPLQLTMLVRQRDDRHEWQLNPHAANVLVELEGPVAFVAVAGLARQGKSTLLAGQTGGFQVSPSDQPCTQVGAGPVECAGLHPGDRMCTGKTEQSTPARRLPARQPGPT
ncbi:hypothetical protein ABPG75_000056 [Micractinium tetrahymenae]